MATKKVMINFELLYCYNSYLFCISRAYLLSKNIHIPNEYRNNLELKSILDAFNFINGDKLDMKGNFEEFQKLFKYYLNGIKPLLYTIETVHLLSNNGW